MVSGEGGREGDGRRGTREVADASAGVIVTDASGADGAVQVWLRAVDSSDAVP